MQIIINLATDHVDLNVRKCVIICKYWSKLTDDSHIADTAISGRTVSGKTRCRSDVLAMMKRSQRVRIDSAHNYAGVTGAENCYFFSSE